MVLRAKQKKKQVRVSLVFGVVEKESEERMVVIRQRPNNDQLNSTRNSPPFLTSLPLLCVYGPHPSQEEKKKRGEL